MNNNTENKIEETFEAARERLNDYRNDYKYSNRDVFNHGFTSGINWQKEKDKAINDSLLNALKNIAAWPGNLEDERYLSKTGANDSALRGSMVVAMRSMAKEAIKKATE